MASTAAVDYAPVPRWRRWMVGMLAVVLVAGHGYDIISQTEHWPFSFYPMYGRVQKKSRLRVLSLCAIVWDGKRERQIRVTDQNFVPQLSESRLRNILMVAWGRDGAGKNAERDTARILRDYLKLYESRRIAGLHGGSPIVETQLCQITWTLKPGAAGQKARSVEPLLGVRADGTLHRYVAASTAPASRAATTEESDETDN